MSPTEPIKLLARFFFILCIHVRAYLTRPKFITAFTCLCCERLLDVYNNILFKSFYKLHKTFIIFDNENDAYQLKIKDELENRIFFFFKIWYRYKKRSWHPPPLKKIKTKRSFFFQPQPPEKKYGTTHAWCYRWIELFLSRFAKKKSILIHDCTIMCVYLL